MYVYIITVYQLIIFSMHIGISLLYKGKGAIRVYVTQGSLYTHQQYVQSAVYHAVCAI